MSPVTLIEGQTVTVNLEIDAADNQLVSVTADNIHVPYRFDGESLEIEIHPHIADLWMPAEAFNGTVSLPWDSDNWIVEAY